MKKNNNNSYSEKLKKLSVSALFCAIAYICVLFAPIKVSFLTFECKDAVLAVSGMILDPVYALVSSAIVSFIESVSVSSTGPWGLLMNFLSTAVFTVTVSVIYKYKRTLAGAVIGLISAIILSTAVMLGANLIITPIYMGVSQSDVVALIPSLLLPFNLIKYIINSALVVLIYKPLSSVLKKSHFIVSKENHTKKGKLNTLPLYITAAGIILACILFYIFVMKGNFSLF